MKKIKLKYKIIVFSLLFLLTVGISYAFFMSEDAFENRFNAMKYDVSLEEEFYNTWGTKKVKLKNNDSAAVVLRVSYNELWSLKEDATLDSDDSLPCYYNDYEENSERVLTLSNKINGEDVVNKEWTLEWSQFNKSSDGWYYYSKVLDSNDEVNILNSITLREDLLESTSCYKNYDIFDYELRFNYEVIQADSNAISEIWGYDVDINNGDISWDF